MNGLMLILSSGTSIQIQSKIILHVCKMQIAYELILSYYNLMAFYEPNQIYALRNVAV